MMRLSSSFPLFILLEKMKRENENKREKNYRARERKSISTRTSIKEVKQEIDVFLWFGFTNITIHIISQSFFAAEEVEIKFRKLIYLAFHV